MPDIIAFCNRKGGSGKTTTAVHVAGGLCRMGQQVLLVDCDPQAHASLWLLGAKQPATNIMQVLTGEVSLSDAIYDTMQKGLSILPSHNNLSEFEARYTRKKGAAFILKNSLDNVVEQFDYIIFDTPPYIGLMLVSVLTCCQSVFVTVPLQFLALDGLFEITNLVKRIGARANPMLSLEGIIPVMFDRRLKSSWLHLKELKAKFGRTIYPEIRQNIKLAEAPARFSLVYDYAPGSNGAHDYIRLTKAIATSVGAPTHHTAQSAISK